MVSDPIIKKKPPKKDAPVCTIATSDIINKKIDIGAQYSLMRKLSGDRFSRIEASSMFMAIKDGRLDGILLPPRKAVSDRGARMKPPTGYWDLIPKGESSTCLLKPAGEDPMIVYREKMTDAQIDAALTAAWSECGLLNLAEPCEYVVDLHKPEVECKTDKDCLDKNKGDFCNTDTNTCGRKFPDDHIFGPACVFPRCDTSVSTQIYPACGLTSANVPRECVPVSGETCGVCEGVTDKANKCHEANEGRHRKENKKCRDAHTPQKTLKYGVECAKHAAKCESGSLAACARFGECFVDPKPYKEYKKCLNREVERYHKEAQRCKQL